jgi:hypothetical protein
MKKLTYISAIMILLTSPIIAAEKKDCSKLKKFTKDFFTCKSSNIKSAISNKVSKTENPLKNIVNYQKKAWSKKN